jgi:hypothetical protein
MVLKKESYNQRIVFIVLGQTCNASNCTAGNGKRKHVMFVSVALWGHAQPLLRMAEEMANRGYRVSFATHNLGKDWIAQGPRNSGMEFFSAGEFPIPDLRTKLGKITKDSSNFRGILALFNEVYLPLVEPMYDELYPQLAQKNNRPDIMVIDIGTLGAQHIAHKLNIKYVVNSPTLHFQLGKEAVTLQVCKASPFVLNIPCCFCILYPTAAAAACFRRKPTVHSRLEHRIPKRHGALESVMLIFSCFNLP